MTPSFDGETYNAKRDGKRLSSQLERVRSYMTTHGWVTVGELRAAAGGSDSSITARIRDLRKERFGGHSIVRKHVENGIWEYRLVQ